MKKVLVTGATGFIGNYVVEELLMNKFQVIATSAHLEKAQEMPWYDRVEYIPFNLVDLSVDINYHALFNKPDLMVHLAWEGLPNYKSDFHIKENLPRHTAFLTNLINWGLRDLTVTGTCFEYGMQEGRLSEDILPNPSNVYAMAKNQLRLNLEPLLSTSTMSLKWARLFYMYGKGQSPNSLLSQLQSAIDRGDTEFNMSPGDQLRDYLPVEAVARNIVQIATQTNVNGIVNCCSGTPVQVKDLVADYLKKKQASIKLNLGVYPYPDIEPKNFWGDTTKLNSVLTIQ
jgi:dTDP-6-deoxy-L-talose 4-dehydrogenase (NAD+)